MKTVYLIAAIVGAVVPYIFFTRFFLGGDASFGAFVAQAFANAPAAGLSADIMVSSAVFWIWSYGEAKRAGMSRWWAYVVVNMAIGLSCAFPLFLYVRERRS